MDKAATDALDKKEESKKTKKGSWKRRLFVILGIVVLAGLLAGSFAVFGSFSDGYRAGTVVKLSKKGFVFKTFEGQLSIGGAAGSDGGDIASSIWSFSVARGDVQVVQAIEDAVDSGSRVKLYYKEKFFQFDWRGDTKYFVYKVEKVGQ